MGSLLAMCLTIPTLTLAQLFLFLPMTLSWSFSHCNRTHCTYFMLQLRQVPVLGPSVQVCRLQLLRIVSKKLAYDHKLTFLRTCTQPRLASL